MLTSDDINLIKQLRNELEYLRSVPVTLERLVESGEDPYTKEPITETVTEVVNALIKPIETDKNLNERILIDGVETIKEGLQIKFSNDVNLNGVDHVYINGNKYKLISTTQRGIGTVNRYECIVRRVI